MFQRLLICTSLTDGLQRLVNFIPSLAVSNIQEITFLHCVPLNEAGAIARVDTAKIEKAQQRLQVAQNQTPTGVKVTVRVESGRPVDLILKVAKERQVDLLMMGYSLRSAVSEKLFGSTSAGVYDRTAIPVLTVRPQLISTYTTEELSLRCRHLFRHLMLPYDGTPTSKYLIGQVKQRVAQTPQSVLEACHVYWIIDDCDRRNIPPEPYLEKAQQELVDVKAELEPLNLQVTVQARLGSPVFEILNASLEPDISAIAICHNPRTKFWEKPVPSFTQELLRHSWHPVLYFPFPR